MGIANEEAQEKFGFLLDAFAFGAPPHGGIAFGWDRITALLAGVDSIREVIAFPKSGGGVDPLTDAPAPITPPQRKESGIDAVAKTGPADRSPTPEAARRARLRRSRPPRCCTCGSSHPPSGGPRWSTCSVRRSVSRISSCIPAPRSNPPVIWWRPTSPVRRSTTFSPACSPSDLVHDGAITMEPLDTVVSDAAVRAEKDAPGDPDDAIVWEELDTPNT